MCWSSLLEGPNSPEVCGYSNAPPTLVNPGNRTSTVGQAVTLQLVGSDPASQPLTYSATGLPTGLSVMASTGYISGAGTTAGSYYRHCASVRRRVDGIADVYLGHERASRRYDAPDGGNQHTDDWNDVHHVVLDDEPGRHRIG